MTRRARALLFALALVGAALAALLLRPPPGPTRTAHRPRPLGPPPSKRVLLAPPRPAATETGAQPKAPPEERKAIAPETTRTVAIARLGPVRGVVVDATNGRPVAGAWVAWRPQPAELAEHVLADPELREPGFTMISDADGRFEVERLPDDLHLAHEVHVVASGYARARAVAPPAGELRIELVRSGTLEVHSDPPGAFVVEGPHGRLDTSLAIAWGDRVRFPFVEPGRYRVRAGTATKEAAVAPGGFTAIELVAARPRATEGVVLDARGVPASEVSLAFGADAESADREEPVLATTDRAGRFSVELVAGRHRATWIDGPSERPLETIVESGARVELRLPPRGDPVRVTLLGAEEDELGLVRLDGRELVSLRAEGARTFVGEAPDGRWALFLGAALLRELELPRDRSIVVERTPRELVVTWELPPTIGDAVSVRVLVGVVPEAIAARADLRARFERASARELLVRRGQVDRFEVLAPGRYELVGSSELGDFRVPVELGEKDGRARVVLGR